VWTTVGTEGAIVWTLPDWGLVVELMPIRYKRDLVRSMVDDFGLDRDAFFRRVHGSRFQDLLEDKGYFWTAMERRERRIDGATPPATLHYRLEHAPSRITGLSASAAPAGVPGPRTLTVGPYAITAYVPEIDYATWTCAQSPTAGRAADETAGTDVWQAVELPTARQPDPSVYAPPIAFRIWGALPVSCRGRLTHDPGGRGRRHVIVSIRTPAPSGTRVVAFAVNGTEVAPLRATRHAAVAHSEDVRFDVTDVLRPGRNELALRIEGRGSVFDLDVYEDDGAGERRD
jgi:hypothetical protein